MKPAQRFEIGQAVTLKIKFQGRWNPNTDVSRCKIGEIYHVDCYYWVDNTWYITLKEMPPDDGFMEHIFDPVELTTEQITELIEEALTEKV